MPSGFFLIICSLPSWPWVLRCWGSRGIQEGSQQPDRIGCGALVAAEVGYGQALPDGGRVGMHKRDGQPNRPASIRPA